MTKVSVKNLSATATEDNLKEFFSFSGEISSVVLSTEDDGSKSAIVEFKEETAVEQALLLEGAVIVDQPVHIESCAEPVPAAEGKAASALDMVKGLMDKGFMLATGVVDKAKAFDEQKGYSAAAKTKAEELNEKYKIKEKADEYAKLMGEKAKAMDEKYKIKDNAGKAAASAKEMAGKAAEKAMPAVQKGMGMLSDGFNKLTTKDKPAADKK